jgi:hypothetical protein
VADIADGSTDRLERLLRATVDCATYRIDAWVSAPATRRLKDLVAGGPPPSYRLGTYGWVDAPRPGTPGPTKAGFLHAPSPNQAVTAMVLRDCAINDPEATRWQMNLASTVVRAADRLGETVRTGAHLSEALGREVERAVGDKASVERLRRDFPIRSEHAGRRVCDGQAVLAAPPATLVLPQLVLAQLDDLRRAVDAYSDLLVAEAVHDVVEGRAESAGAAMESCSPGASTAPRPPTRRRTGAIRTGTAPVSSRAATVPTPGPTTSSCPTTTRTGSPTPTSSWAG